MQIPAFLTSAGRLRTALYGLLWLIFVLNGLYDPEKRQFEFSVFTLTFQTVHWLTAWFAHACVLNRYLNHRRYAAVLAGLAVAVAGFIGLRYLLEQVVTWHLLGAVNYDPGDLTASHYITDNLYFVWPALAIAFVFKMVEDRFLFQQERAELLSEKATAELAFLRSQVNPHFLFNTLNNIYALAYTKSDAAPGAILKLSELMRYMLYDSHGTQRVALSKEVQYLQNLVDLEKLRVPRAQVQFNVEGNTDLYRIEPLLLVSFVENAFKHGDLSNPAQPLIIDLQVRKGRLLLDVLNQKNHHQKDAAGGIGLQNVRRRLDLLYPTQYVLRVEDETDTYHCHLELTL